MKNCNLQHGFYVFDNDLLMYIQTFGAVDDVKITYSAFTCRSAGGSKRLQFFPDAHLKCKQATDVL